MAKLNNIGGYTTGTARIIKAAPFGSTLEEFEVLEAQVYADVRSGKKTVQQALNTIPRYLRRAAKRKQSKS